MLYCVYCVYWRLLCLLALLRQAPQHAKKPGRVPLLFIAFIGIYCIYCGFPGPKPSAAASALLSPGFRGFASRTHKDPYGFLTNPQESLPGQRLLFIGFIGVYCDYWNLLVDLEQIPYFRPGAPAGPFIIYWIYSHQSQF